VWGVLKPEPAPALEPKMVFNLRSFDHRAGWRVECSCREVAPSVAYLDVIYRRHDGAAVEADEVAREFGIASRDLRVVEGLGAAEAVRQAILDPQGRHTVIVLPYQCQPGGVT
jgi:hypothetical protein